MTLSGYSLLNKNFFYVDIGGESLTANDAPTDTGELTHIMPKSPASFSTCNNSLGSGLGMDMTLQLQMSPSSLFSPDDLLKKASLRSAQLDQGGAVCSENLNISDFIIPPSSEQLDFTCATLNCGSSPASCTNISCQLHSSCEQSKENVSIDFNQLEITCELIESKDVAVDLSSHTNNDNDQADFMCVTSNHRDTASLLPKLAANMHSFCDQTADGEASTMLQSEVSQLEITCQKDVAVAFNSHSTDHFEQDGAYNRSMMLGSCNMLEHKCSPNYGKSSNDFSKGVEIECATYSSSPLSLSSKSFNLHGDSVRTDIARDCDKPFNNTVDLDPSFFEEQSPFQFQDSTSSKNTTSEEAQQSVCNQTLNTFEMPTLKRIYDMKAEAMIESPIIETPQAILIKNDVSHRYDSSEHTVMESDSPGKVDNMLSTRSVSPSPSSSVYSKFCRALNCDQTLGDQTFGIYAYSPEKDVEAQQEVTDKVSFSAHLGDIQTRYMYVSRTQRTHIVLILFL